MNYTYKRIRGCGDATTDYDIIGDFPVTFIDFFKWVLEHEKSFRVEFGATNECYGGWLGNRLEVNQFIEQKGWYFERQNPEAWFDEIAYKNVTACWANGGWDQMTYFCTFE